ncbi:MAG: TonB family protein [Candidatus Sulfotelmatobacter sp.]|jgi:protein TonB
MALRCLLFSSDGKSAALICQVLAGLGAEGDSCSEGPAAVEKVIQQSFQIVIIDWDMQPEAGLLLTTARERKAAERPLTLAIVSDDTSVPKALQAGANSILRKPILLNQVQDTLKTACDLLRARESAAQAAAASAASSARPACLEQGSESPLRAGEFLPSSQPAPGAQFLVESDTQKAFQQPATESTGPLKELEPMAAAVQSEPIPAPAPPPLSPQPSSLPSPDEPRGLEWYLNRRAATLPPSVQQAAAAAAATAAAPAPAKPELVGFDQMVSPVETSPVAPAEDSAPEREATPEPPEAHDQKAEDQLFAYITDGREGSEEEERPRSHLGKKAVVGALVLAACAIVAAPQAPWHPKALLVWARGHQALHAWLNPQTVTAPQAPPAHEDFARPGDEYKLPVAESIPDATTDPSQIRVVPVVDPTAKKPNNPGSDTDQTAVQPEGAGTNPADQAPATQVQQNPPGQPATAPPVAAAPTPSGAASPGSAAAAAAAQLRSDAQAAASSPAPSPVAPALTQPEPPVSPLPHSVSTPPTSPAGIPSSLKSDIASMTPEASGNKPVEAALPSIEPVDIPEATARGLVTDQPAPPYPASAKGQQGTVVLQVLIGRDGTVQDAKFLQGSLAFARAAIDGVKQWKFKPYLMNGRPVSVQAPLTIPFKPPS